MPRPNTADAAGLVRRANPSRPFQQSPGAESRLLPDQLYRPGDAARVLACSRSTLYQLMATGSLNWVLLGDDRRIRGSELLAFMERNSHHGEGLP